MELECAYMKIFRHRDAAKALGIDAAVVPVRKKVALKSREMFLSHLINNGRLYLQPLF